MKLKDFLWILALIGMLIFSIQSYFSTPVVYWSTSQNKCVKVIHNGIEMDCSGLPEKYERVWVK
jgi:hypothetical protein